MPDAPIDINSSSRNVPMVIPQSPKILLSPKGIALASSVFIIGSLIGGGVLSFYQDVITSEPQKEAESAFQQKKEDRHHRALQAFNKLSLGAKSVIVIDHTTQSVLYEKQADVVRPLASVTKLQTALTAHEILGPSTIVTIIPEDLATEGESGLRSGDQFTVKDLSNFMLVTSSNDAASALGRSIAERTTSKTYQAGADAIAQGIGLSGASSFIGPTGLDVDEEAQIPSSQSTARDISKLIGYLLTTKWDVVEESRDTLFTLHSIAGRSIQGNNTNILASELPGLLISKTGYTLLSGGNLAVAFDADIGRPVIVVILGSSREGRFKDLNALYNAVQEYYRQYNQE